MIEVKHLTKRYGKHTAVDDISFTVQDGCIYGLLGPNGAGKSTTMNMITGYLAPTGGTVAIDGHDVQEEPKEAKACIGYLPEVASFFRSLSVEDNIKAVLEIVIDDESKRENMLEELLSEFSIAHLRKSPAIALSGGERRRLEIARALASQPHFILLDDP